MRNSTRPRSGRKKILAATSLIGLAVGTPGIVATDQAGAAPLPVARASTLSTSPAATPAGASGPPVCSSESVVGAWPLARQVAQLLMPGLQFGDQTESHLAASGAGGIYFLGQPAAGSGPALQSEMQGIRSTAAAYGQVAPILATDEEGGGVARLSNVIGPLPWERDQASQYTPAQLNGVMAAHGAAMRRLGITMDLAPVLGTAPANDQIGAEGQRTYSRDGHTVAAYGTAAAEGLQSGDEIPVLKHFPGLGGANANTDQGPATVPPLSVLQSNDLIPFQAGAAAGIPAVMMSNAMVPGLTGSQPASISPAAYRYLRDQTGFHGLVLTDSLSAGALSAAGYSQSQAAVAAIAAGADMTLIDASAFDSTVAALSQAVTSGVVPAAVLRADVVRVLAAKGVAVCPNTSLVATSSGGGYWQASSDGSVRTYGLAGQYGSAAALPLHAPIVGMAATPDGKGYWLVGADGGVFSYGDAQFYGSAGNLPLAQPIVGMTPTPDGKGYWLVAADGGVFSYGDARYHGSTGNIHLAQPIVGMSATPSGDGYRLVASDGGVFDFGDAGYHGSTGNIHLAQPIVGMSATPDGKGYWLVASDGGVFSFGDAGFFGSAGNIRLDQPIVGMAPTPDGQGYWLTAPDGGTFTYGDAGYHPPAG